MPAVKRPNTSLSTDEMPSSYCFHKDVDSVARIRNEFIQKGDLDGLEVWDREKANDLARHYQVIERIWATLFAEVV